MVYFDLYQLHGMKTYNDYQNVVSKDGALKTLIEAKEKDFNEKQNEKNLGRDNHNALTTKQN